MATYRFEIDVFTIGKDGAIPAGTLPGEVEAERYSSACVRSWSRIHEACRRIRQEFGCNTAVSEVHIRREQ
jgi:hypothetical protein